MMRYHKENPKQGRILMSGGPRDQQNRLRSQQDPVFSTDEVLSLKSEILSLKEELHSARSGGGFTAEDIDAAINDALPEIENLKKEIENLKVIVKSKEDSYNEIVSKFGERDKAIFDLKETLSLSKAEAIAYIKEIDNLKKDYTEVNNKLFAAEAKIGFLNEKIESLNEIIKTKDDAIETFKKLAARGSVPTDVAVVDNGRPKMDQVFIDPLEQGSGKNMESFINVEGTKTSEKVNVSDKVNKLKNIMGSLPTRR